MKRSLVIVVLFNLLITFSYFAQKREVNKLKFEKTLSYYNEQLQNKTPESHDIQFIQEYAELLNKLAEDIYLTKSSAIQYWKSNNWENNYQSVYTYTPQNKVDVVINQSWNGNAWVNDTKIDYDYNNSSSSNYNITYAWNGSAWDPKYQSTYTYNENNNTGQWLQENYTNSAWVPDSRYTYEFAQGNVSSYITESYVNQVWKTYYKYSMTYLEGTNKQTEQLIQSWTNNTWVDVGKQSYLYNDDKNLIERIYYSFKNTNSDKNEIERTYYSSINSGWEEMWRYLYDYYPTPDNNLLKTKIYQTKYVNNPTRYNEDKWDYTYTPTDKPETETHSEWDYVTNGWKDTSKTSNTYNPQDYVIEILVTKKNGGLDENYSKTIKEYEKGTVAVKVNLTTSVNPSEASADGCAVTPSSSPFDSNSTVTLDATAAAGWVWDKWIGDLTGNTKPQQLLMDNDKNVIANFQPILTLSLNSPADNYLCLPGQNEELTVATANIFVDGVDWQLTGISFSAVEKFKPDYTEVWIEYAGTKLKGTISTDAEGYAANISFSPTQQINEGNTLAVRLFYKFNYPSKVADKYIPDAITEVKKYKVSIHVGQINCVPIPDPAKPGVKDPPYPPNIFYSNTQTLASVWNISKTPNIPFASIQEAINSSLTTDSDIISLCSGLYTENIKVSKSLSIKSAFGKDVTIVQAKNKDGHVFEIAKNNSTIKGLNISGAANANKAGIFISNQQINNTLIDDCIITKNSNGISGVITTSSSANSKITLTNSEVIKNDFAGVYLTSFNISGKDIELSYNGKEGLYLVPGDATLERIKINKNGGHGLFGYGVIKINGTENQIRENQGSGITGGGGEFNIDGAEIVKNKGAGIFSSSSNISINVNGTIPINPNYVTRIDSNGSGIFAKLVDISGYNLSVSNNGYQNENISPFAAILGNKLTLENVKVVNNKSEGIHGLGAVRLIGFNNIIRENSDIGIVGHSGIQIDGAEIVNNKGGGILATNGTILINSSGNAALNSNYVTRIDSNKGGIFAKFSTIEAHYISVSYNGYQSDKISPFAAILGNEITLENVKVVNNKNAGIEGLGLVRLIGFNSIVRENYGWGIMGHSGVQIDGAVVAKNKGLGIGNLYGNIFINANGSSALNSNSETRVDSNDFGGIWAYGGQVSAFNLILRNNGFEDPSTGGGNAIDAYSAFLRNVIITRNKNNGIKAKFIAYKGGIVSYNGGWGAALSGKASESEFNEGVHINGNALGAVWFMGGSNKSSPTVKKMSMENSPMVINNCSLTNNFGDGIKNEGAESFSINNSNIAGNMGIGMNNTNNTAIISAENNWWGSATGPSGIGNGSGDKISGNVLFSNWKSNKVALISAFATDSSFVTSELVDSVEISIKNFNRINDEVSVTVTDSLDWITSNKVFIISLKDSSGSSFFVKYKVPSNTIPGTSNRIKLVAESLIEPSDKSNSEHVINVYNPILKEITLLPDSVVLVQGKSQQFQANGMDQYGREMSFEKTWSTDGGSISNQGLFFAGSQIGEFYVKVKSTSLSLEKAARVKILSSIPQLSKMVVFPDSIKIKPGQTYEFIAFGLDQFDSLYTTTIMWSATGGTIDTNGIFIAGQLDGNYFVLASDSSEKFTQKALVIVSSTTGIKVVEIPHDYTLYQNYPNPFNPSTEIKYAIPLESKVKIDIYSILGELVKTLVNDFQTAGNYSVAFDASRFASGIYFYRLTANSTIITKKMLLIK
ncbi:MAG: T9SS type A sorting domain-containing protein [Ignavibacteriaceae bacterium]|nr:T9SS type A sorting domain-containing protein [Ignavibacteriaceae bacterium]